MQQEKGKKSKSRDETGKGKERKVQRGNREIEGKKCSEMQQEKGRKRNVQRGNRKREGKESSEMQQENRRKRESSKTKDVKSL